MARALCPLCGTPMATRTTTIVKVDGKPTRLVLRLYCPKVGCPRGER